MARQLTLGTSDIGRLEQSLRRFSAELRDSIPRAITDTLATIGAEHVNANLLAIPNIDGNSIGVVYVEREGKRARVVNTGTQVGFLEYGTGAAGAASPHPLVNEAGIEYSDRLQWVFFNQWTGRYQTSHGLPPQGQVLNAGLRLESEAAAIAANELRRAVSRL